MISAIIPALFFIKILTKWASKKKKKKKDKESMICLTPKPSQKKFQK